MMCLKLVFVPIRYLCLPMFSDFYRRQQCLLMFTDVYRCLPKIAMFTDVYRRQQCLPKVGMFTKSSNVCRRQQCISSDLSLEQYLLHLLCIKNIPVVVVSAQTGFIRLNYWDHTAGKFAGSNLSGCTTAFVVSKMKPLKAYLTRYMCTEQFLTQLCFTVPLMSDVEEDHTCMFLLWSNF